MGWLMGWPLKRLIKWLAADLKNPVTYSVGDAFSSCATELEAVCRLAWRQRCQLSGQRHGQGSRSPVSSDRNAREACTYNLKQVPDLAEWVSR